MHWFDRCLLILIWISVLLLLATAPDIYCNANAGPSIVQSEQPTQAGGANATEAAPVPARPISKPDQENAMHRPKTSPTEPLISQLLDAMTTVESDWKCDAVGDDGKSLGPLQISRAYYDDAAPALYQCPAYKDACTRISWSRALAKAYMKRHEPTHFPPTTLSDCKALASLHRKGPDWRLPKNRKATDEYWRRVSRHLPKDTLQGAKP